MTTVPKNAIPVSLETFRDQAESAGRAASTAIYFLLARGERSHWHRVDAAEAWHHYAGAPLELEIALHAGAAVERIRAARRAIDATDEDVLLVGRTEGFLVGQPNIDEAVARLVAYAHAGADCLYAPGINKREQIEAVVKAVAPKPVNFLNSGAFGFTVDEIAAMGVRRISVGGSLARVAMHAFIRVATEIARDGKFDGFAGLIGGPILSVYPGIDQDMLPLALVVVILGGTGSLLGSFVGSIVIGFIYNFGQALLPELAYFILFFPMVLVLVLRPRGLFGGQIL